jgi:transcriptional regulator with XRE-family HTH domain
MSPRPKRRTRSLAARLVEIRREHDLSQEEFGSRIGLRQSAISKYERNHPMPKVVKIAVAAIYGVNLAWLESGEPPKYLRPEQVPFTSEDLRVLSALKRQNALYDLIRGQLKSRKPKA